MGKSTRGSLPATSDTRDRQPNLEFWTGSNKFKRHSLIGLDDPDPTLAASACHAAATKFDPDPTHSGT